MDFSGLQSCLGEWFGVKYMREACNHLSDVGEVHPVPQLSEELYGLHRLSGLLVLGQAESFYFTYFL